MSYIRKCNICEHYEDDINISNDYDEDVTNDWGIFTYQGKDYDACSSCAKKIKKFIEKK